MGEEAHELAPWEIPPDEAYWQALLNEGEYSEEEQDGPPAFYSEIPTQTATGSQKTKDEEKSWDTFLACQAEDRTVDLTVVGFNRGGLLVKWNGVVGFVPASQLCDDIPSRDDRARREEFAAQVGKTLTLKVIEVDRAQDRLILSERVARHVQKPDRSILDELSPGDVRRGRVTNLCSFGVFVDFGGVEGLIHISELSWGRVGHPSDVLQSGQDVEVYVLNVDRERGRVGLSLKRLYPDPWETVEGRYGIGQVVEGTVTNVVNFGAFVRIEDGLEGLIHSSEWTNAAHQQPVREGDIVRVRVASLDQERHRMGLSLEQIVGDHFPS